jgi:signal recognition particle receptor subunit beta
MGLGKGMGFDSPAPLRSDIGELASASHVTEPNQAIGAPLERARVELLRLIEGLSGLLGEHAAPLLEAAANQLEQRTCRIAVIGQIKAGKSTFINALVGRPGFLPADINPWTVVVTALHFRSSPTPPEHAAVFQLFSVDEWKELADGRGRLRELTERLVPGFQPDLLRAQLEVMRKRAERRLGPKFGELLGKCHRFDAVTPELLADYVSAGHEGAEAKGQGSRRIYSDITRSADLYFNESPFAYPITLIDTPGTNDPFLVRDEITRRSLENPDFYVFVISALQPLSAADITMLRLLNGLHKDRIVVFVNRTDQLTNPSAEASAIRAAVEKRLRAEFPSLEIPVICGSAWLGSMKLPASAEASSRQLSSLDRSRVSAAMYMNSGMREVSAAITGLMCTSSIAMLLRQIAVCLVELVRSAEVTDRAELKSIYDLLEVRRQESAQLQVRVAEEQESLAAFSERAATLQASFKDIERHFDELIGSAKQTLRQQLTTLVREFADDQADALLHALDSEPKRRSWRCDVNPLRERMEAAYLASFEQAAGDLARVEQFLYPQLKVIVASLLPGYQGRLLEAPAWPPGLTPSIAPLSNKVTMDLGTSWWRQWFATRRAAEERASQLHRLIEDDFFKVADDLVAEAATYLRERVDYIMQRVNAISRGLRTGIERRSANLAREHALLDGAGGEGSLERFEMEQNQRAEACVRKQDAFAAALKELEGLLQGLDAVQGDTRLQ